MHKVIPEKQPDWKEDRKVKIYPTFQIDSEDLPELKNCSVGQKYPFVMEVEMMSMRQGKEWQGEGGNDKKIRASFKILKVGIEKEDFEKEYARKRSGAPRA